MIYLVQCRLGPHEFIIEVEANTVGEALLSTAEYLYQIKPHAIYEVYEVKQKVCLDVVIEDLILN